MCGGGDGGREVGGGLEMGASAIGQELESKEFLIDSIKVKDNKRVIYSQRLSRASSVQTPGTPSQPMPGLPTQRRG